MHWPLISWCIYFTELCNAENAPIATLNTAWCSHYFLLFPNKTTLGLESQWYVWTGKWSEGVSVYTFWIFIVFEVLYMEILLYISLAFLPFYELSQIASLYFSCLDQHLEELL